MEKISADTAELFEILPAAVFACDIKGKITYFNQKAADFWEKPHEISSDIYYQSLNIYHPDGTILNIDLYPMQMAIRERTAVKDAEILIERPDGVCLYVESHCTPILNPLGELTGIITMLIDKSDKMSQVQHNISNQKSQDNLVKHLELKVIQDNLDLQKSEDRYHKMVEEVEDYAILMLDTDGNVQNWNLGAQKIKGYTEEEILGKNFSLFYLDEDRERNLPQSLIRQAELEGKATHEGWRLKKNGEKFWGFIVLTALHDDENNVIGFSKVTRDLTEKKLLEDQLREHAKNIEFRNKQLEEYAHIASHDLQEPLRKIRIFSEMLASKITDKEALTDIHKIESAAERMTVLIKDVLAYSEIAQGQHMYSWTDLNHVLNNVKEDCELAILEKNIKIEQSILPEIYAVPIQMHQLFSNLITNALKFSKPLGIISILGTIIPKSQANDFFDFSDDTSTDYLELKFRDNGLGFDPKYSDHVFKLFQRLDTTKTGTGIGLALCKKIIENHGGKITVKSKAGEGTEFLIYLPLKLQDGTEI
ncbi:PAS domain S-box protein [Flavobacterium artemisiae]|uniref:histidine kinase n=1 Tax=Flavobacterium artemisiae TaxID=2126556 RepID=A0ABW4HKD5_9FLAO